MKDKFVLEYSLSRYATGLFFDKLYSKSELQQALKHFLDGLVMSGVFDFDSMHIIGLDLLIDNENEIIVVRILD